MLARSKNAVMSAAHTSLAPAPPPRQAGPIVHASAPVQRWLTHYWQKLGLPAHELSRLAITQERKEYMLWTGKRLNFMVLGCYCYLHTPHHTGASRSAQGQKAGRANSRNTGPAQPLPGLGDALQLYLPSHRHLIFIEPDMQPQSIEVTVAHELIHLADRVNGTPRRHRHHGYDSIAADEAAITGYHVEDLRRLLHEESTRREYMRRERRPIRYLYECTHCGKEYPRTRRYSQSVSCSHCDKAYNPQYQLTLRHPLAP